MKHITVIIAIVLGFASCKKQSSPTPSTTNNSTPPPSSSSWTKPTTFFDAVSVTSFCSIGTELFISTNLGAYMSIDNGITWTCLNKSLPDSSYNSTSLWTNGTALFCAKQGNSSIPTYTQIYKSTDYGHSWAPIWTQTVLSLINSVSFIGINIFLINGNNIFISTNNGTSWTQSYLGSVSMNFVYPPIVTDGINLFATDGGSILKSTNNGSIFTKLANDTIATLSGVTNIASNGSKLFIGATSSKGVYLSTNSGINWSPINSGIVVNIIPLNIRSIYSDGVNIYATSINRVFVSNNNGSNWHQLGNDIPGSNGVNQVYVYSILKTGGFIYANTSSGLYRIPG